MTKETADTQTRLDIKAPGVFYGWWIVAFAALAGFMVYGPGLYSFTLFVKPLTEEFGWNRAITGGVVSIFFLTAPLALLTGYMVARIEAVNSKLNAVVQLSFESAREQARRADAVLARGRPQGPLHGTAFTIKDTIDTAGVITTAGTHGRKSHVPEKDATVVERLRAAGAILLGKTNTPELVLAGETENLVYGQTNNPYDLARTPGGSSGGSAAIIAAGGSALDIDTDAWGSVRAPAHFCGIAGLKPSFGRVPRTGSLPPIGLGAIGRLIHFGPMARYVEDLNLILPIISGVDWHDPTVVPMDMNDPGEVEIKPLRIAYYADNGIVSPSAETEKIIQSAVTALVDAGSTVTEHRPDAIEQTFNLLIGLSIADGGAWIKRILEYCGTTRISPVVQMYFEADQSLSVSEYTMLLENLDRFRVQMLGFLKDYDVIVCPVYEKPAALHRGTSHNDFTYAAAHNLTGWPVATVRGGTSAEGLPIGVQVVARPWRDDVALAVARYLQDALCGYQPPDL